jgi:phosphoribosylamine--glycine ligase
VHLTHAGTRLDGDTLVASGGRVLGAVARGADLFAARAAAYAAIDDLDAPTLFHRTDIAARAAAGQIPTPSL